MVEGIPLTLPPLDSGSEWLPRMAFFNSGQGYSSHATTTGSEPGVDLEVVFQWLSLITVMSIPLTLPPLDPGSNLPGRPPSTCSKPTIGWRRMLQ